MSKSEVILDVKAKKDRGIIKAIGSVLFAIIASSHHWVHTLLIALGLTTLSSSLLSLSPSTKIIFLLVSLVVSVWFILVAKRKWSYDRPSAWVYLISSIISIILVITSLPQAISAVIPPSQQQQQQQPQQQKDIHGH
ncbi:hypothetical protein [Desulfosporosinus sp. BICA1-9]|uniref:hypothetical protein n=1 Tax=Desulfosporosinus sp. BICA1-9 TaxID=1531958 RepID=UPI00054B8AB0|nr:hypothetical protein [Desulfosporosinus sp. BICA1-9]KJS48759.1 MAG: hypothetical protein VR66_12265 [Peptococcaceae bacterium BRH_c23]KJS82078.1 MAG: hypothetical protein JL57_25015 [Desulfosporosinus sp. BICA1-9]HBW34551.1 hypothetical protein [Desulfosporosinus sp.]